MWYIIPVVRGVDRSRVGVRVRGPGVGVEAEAEMLCMAVRKLLPCTRFLTLLIIHLYCPSVDCIHPTHSNMGTACHQNVTHTRSKQREVLYSRFAASAVTFLNFPG